MGAQQIGFVPMPAVALILSRYDRAKLGSFIEIAIELMDVADGDFDAETGGDDLDGSGAAEEDTPQLNSMIEYFGNPEDAEEDSEDCSHDEGEPDYHKRRRHCRNEGGPGCAISDSDYGGEEPGEPDNGVEHPIYGINQATGPLSPYAS